MRFGQINCGILTASTVDAWFNWKFSKEFKNEDYNENVMPEAQHPVYKILQG